MEKKTVLIADHNPSRRSNIEWFFRYRYQVMSAESTHVVWKIIGENKVDFIILEESLPSFGGLRLLKILKIAYPHVPVVITSDTSSFDSCLQAFRNGARDYFFRPFSHELLLKKTEMILNSLLKETLLGRNYYLADNHHELSHDEKSMLEELPSSGNSGIYRALKYLQKNFQEDISRNELAQIACFSPSHFSRAFRKYVGCSYIKYLTTLRINKAKELLKLGNLTVSEICYFVGYHDLSHFERTFQRITGCSPKVYRNGKQNRNKKQEVQFQKNSFFNKEEQKVTY